MMGQYKISELTGSCLPNLPSYNCEYLPCTFLFLFLVIYEHHVLLLLLLHPTTFTSFFIRATVYSHFFFLFPLLINIMKFAASVHPYKKFILLLNYWFDDYLLTIAGDQKSAPLVSATCSVSSTGTRHNPLLLRSVVDSPSLHSPPFSSK